MDQLENRPAEGSSYLKGTAAEICRRTTSYRVKKEARSFPPPLSSLNLNGQPSFFLRLVRKDDTLTLTEVRIHRPEILRAWRHDGRLILHLIPEDNFEEDDGEEEEEIVKAIRDEEDEFRLGDWKFDNEGLRRCHQYFSCCK
ncbi:hypothetical protein K1719_005470 [Acacia pycnantha]|nr:hypothetical protein K1719_005470 [Acacia pycnantha]